MRKAVREPRRVPPPGQEMQSIAHYGRQGKHGQSQQANRTSGMSVHKKSRFLSALRPTSSGPTCAHYARPPACVKATLALAAGIAAPGVLIYTSHQVGVSSGAPYEATASSSIRPCPLATN